MALADAQPVHVNGPISSQHDNLRFQKQSSTEFPTRPTPLATLPGQLPCLATPLPADLDPVPIASSIISTLSHISSSSFTADALWRDLMALTSTLRTFSSPATILEHWSPLALSRNVSNFELITGSARVMRFPKTLPPDGRTAWVTARFSFDVEEDELKGKGSGLIRLVPSEDSTIQYGKDGSISGWKIWVLTTMLESVEGWGHPDELTPRASDKHANGVTNGDVGHSHSNGNMDETTVHDALIIGGGLAGLSVLGRLAALHVQNPILVDNHAAIGDTWTKSRYESVKLHTARAYGHLPFERTFPDAEYDYFLSSKDLQRGYGGWVERFGLSKYLKLGWTVEKARWDDGQKLWNVTLKASAKNDDVQNGSSNTYSSLETKHLIFATGSGGQRPSQPLLPNAPLYRGTTLHSSSYRHSRAFASKRCLVIGSANTAHDVAEDMVLSGAASVSMLQRNPTNVLPIENYRIIFDRLYNDTIPTETSDREGMCVPLKIQREQVLHGLAALAGRAELKGYWEKLRKAGFRVDDDLDLYHIIYERLGGHYLDVGGCERIIRGEIRMVDGSCGIEGWMEDGRGLRLRDGREIEAEVVVWCTGFEGDLRSDVIGICGEDVVRYGISEGKKNSLSGKGLEGYFGVDGEGEIRGCWRGTGRE